MNEKIKKIISLIFASSSTSLFSGEIIPDVSDKTTEIFGESIDTSSLAQERKEAYKNIDLSTVYLIPKSFLDSNQNIDDMIEEAYRISEQINRNLCDILYPLYPGYKLFFMSKEVLTRYTDDMETIFAVINNQLAKYLKDAILDCDIKIGFYNNRTSYKKRLNVTGTLADYAVINSIGRNLPIYDKEGILLAPEVFFKYMPYECGDQSNIVQFMNYLSGKEIPNSACDIIAEELDYQFLIPIPFKEDVKTNTYDFEKPYAFVSDNKLLELPLSSLNLVNEKKHYNKDLIKWKIENAIYLMNDLFSGDYQYIRDEWGKEITLALTDEELMEVTKKYNRIISDVLSKSFTEKFDVQDPTFLDLVIVCNKRGLPIYDQDYNSYEDGKIVLLDTTPKTKIYD